MINLSSFIAFHARRTPDRCALKYRGEEISYATFDQRIGKVGGWLAQHSLFAAPPFPADSFRLYRSVLAPDGAKHFVEAEYPLAAA